MAGARKGRRNVHVRGKEIEADSITPEQLMAFQVGGGTMVGGVVGGEEFFTFTPNSNQNIKPSIDAKKMLNTIENEYVARGLERQKNLLFTEKPEIEIEDESGDEDGDLEEVVEKDFERAGMNAGLFASMKMSYNDIYGWGCYLMQPEWIRDMDGVIRPGKFMRLAPESFMNPPKDTSGYIGDDILQGIGSRNGVIEFNQTQNDGVIKRLNGVIMMRDPSVPGICGRSKLKSLVPVVSFLSLCYKSQGQVINRQGAPVLFIQFNAEPIQVAGKRDDIEHAKKIIQYWGKESQYILRPNMTPVKLDFAENTVTLKTIEMLKKDIDDHFNPTVFLSDTERGGGAARIDTMKLFIQDAHRMLEDNWEPVVNTYLELNGYDGETVELNLPDAEPDRAQINLQRAQAIDTMGIGTMDEKRVLSGLVEATPEILAEIEKERETRAKMIPGATLGQSQDPVVDGKKGGRPADPISEKQKNGE